MSSKKKIQKKKEEMDEDYGSESEEEYDSS